MVQENESADYVIRSSKSQSFDQRLIREIVRQLESGTPRKELFEKYGMSAWTLRNWMNRYGSPAYHAAKKKPISTSFKRSVVRVVESGMSVRQAQVAYGVKDPSMIRAWIRMFQSENAELAVNNPPLKEKKKQPASAEQQSLEQQLAEAQLKIRALETMIDIAEEQLKIDIRKKSGAKQSPK